jgi:hypothetical protein
LRISKRLSSDKDWGEERREKAKEKTDNKNDQASMFDKDLIKR